MKNNLFGIRTIVFIMALFMFSCGGDKANTSQEDAVIENKEQKFASYEISKTIPLETSNKAQISAYAYLTTETISNELLEASISRIHENLKNTSGFENHAAPNAFAIYLFTSKYKAENMTHEWIAMGTVYPNADKLMINLNKDKIQSLLGLNDKTKTKEEKSFDEINNSLKAHGTDVCTMYQTLFELERSTRKKADEKYPDYGDKNTAYRDQLLDKERKLLFSKYTMNDSVMSQIQLCGYLFCK